MYQRKTSLFFLVALLFSIQVTKSRILSGEDDSDVKTLKGQLSAEETTLLKRPDLVKYINENENIIIDGVPTKVVYLKAVPKKSDCMKAIIDTMM